MAHPMTSTIGIHCPETHQVLTATTIVAAEEAAGPLHHRERTPYGHTNMVLLREDLKTA